MWSNSYVNYFKIPGLTQNKIFSNNFDFYGETYQGLSLNKAYLNLNKYLDVTPSFWKRCNFVESSN